MQEKPEKITLPPKLETNGVKNDLEIEFKRLVIVGANGAGKTRFGSWIEEKYIKKVHRIAAQKSLTMPEFVATKSKEIAEKDFLYGTHSSNDEWQVKDGRKNNRWKNNMNTSLLDDFQQLMSLLFTEELEQLIKYKTGGKKPNTKLDRIKKIWESVLPERKLDVHAGKIGVYSPNQPKKEYNGSEMSDGERVILYLAGEVICAPEKSIIIIDEPESHIHASLINHLFNLIENERADCSFVYLTHSIDFASSRNNTVKIWAKAYNNGVWDYEILGGAADIPEQLYLEILGSRLPVIFTEGGKNSLDIALYSQIFPDFTVKYAGSCSQVIPITKSFNNRAEFHHIQAFGMVDRDYRTEEEVAKLVKCGIWVLDVAEVENLYLIEEVVKKTAEYVGKDSTAIFNDVKTNLLNFFREDLTRQTLNCLKTRLKHEYTNLYNFSSNNIDIIVNEVDTNYKNIDIQSIFDEIETEFKQIIANQDYDGMLRVFNIKNALIPRSNVCNLIGIKDQDSYRDLVVYMLGRNDYTSETIRMAIKAKIIGCKI